MTKSLLVIWASMTAIASCSEARPAESTHDPSASVSAQSAGGERATLTIGIYNVLYALAERKEGTPPSTWVDESTRDQALALKADVLLLQETNAVWEGALRPELAKTYPYCKFHDAVKWAPEGLGLCSKFPILVDDLERAPGAMFPAQHVRIGGPKGHLDVWNVHLQPAIASPVDWEKVHLETRARRKLEVEYFVSKMDPNLPTMIAGDFNERPEGDAFSYLSRVGFDNALPKVGQKAVTWRWAGVTPPLEHQLDHLAYRAASFRVVAAKVERGGRSDHDAVVVTLEIL
ncbi:MAG: endonuclease/exonuclease/phosphatase family protein [Polyangiaceae bacterium]|nr:endonuclease/exonuclease/phosphatase family protein [Polyangiaceae bacterium]